MASHSLHVGALIQEVTEAAAALPSDVFQDDQARRRLQAATERLSGALDSPVEGIRKLCFQAQYLPIARIAIDGGWFQALAVGKKPKTAADLAEETGADEVLIVRLMRVLVAGGFVDEVGSQTYASTPVTDALTVPKIYDGVKHFAYEALPIWAEFPAYTQKKGYAVPTDSATGPFVDVFGTAQWDYFKKNPDRGRSFNSFMQGQREGRGCWLDIYPVKERLVDEFGQDNNIVLLVDVAGGTGHDLRDLRDRQGSRRGRLILEELPEVIEEVDDREGLELIKYDFFTAQPIQGAKAYYFRSILHNWDDQNAVKILQNQAAAMRKGYSKLLINDILIPESKASLFVAGMDFAMMTLLAGTERTPTQWEALLESAGLQIIKVWQVNESAEAIIEATLKD